MHTDDPRLTAYVLGELEPAERAEIEQLLQSDTAAAREVAELREFTTLVRTQLATEPAPALNSAHKDRVLAERHAAEAKPQPNPAEENAAEPQRFPSARIWIPAGIAACFAVWAALFFEPAREKSEESMASATLPPVTTAQSRPTPAQPLPKRYVSDAQPASAPEGQLFPTEVYSGSTQMASNDPLGSAQSFKLDARASGAKDADLAHPTDPAAERFEAQAWDDSVTKGMAAADAPKNAAPSPAEPSKAKMEVAWNRPVRTPEQIAAAKATPLPMATTVTSGTLQPAPLARQPVMQHELAAAPRAKAIGAEQAITQRARTIALSPAAPAAAAAFPAEAEVQTRGDVYGFNTESYDAIQDNAFLPVTGNPLSTFSIDVDTASYANMRRFLTQGTLPPKGAVRIEEMVNYFRYDYPQPPEGDPFSATMEVAACPWTPQHRLLRIGLKAREIAAEKRPAGNLVFLIDVSGSMSAPNKLQLVKESLRLLTDQLSPRDTVAIAVYAGASGTVLEPTSDKAEIRAALDRLQSGGSTNGGAGLRLAYDLAKRKFDKEKANRVILCTDGDFNVGTTSHSELVDLIQAKAKTGVFLTVLGFGYGNLKDSTMEKLADKGNGNYAYIDTLAEGRKVLVEQMAGTLVTVAKDVKMQIEFNPAQISAYRLIGYENRVLAKEDFNDDTKDAGEIGAGHTVTALYELVPANLPAPSTTSVDPLKYQPKPMEEPAKYAAAAPIAPENLTPTAPKSAASNEVLTLKLRWKAPDADKSVKKEYPLNDSGLTWEKSSRDFRWAAAVASFGMLLRESPHKGQATWGSTRELAMEGTAEKSDPYKREFLELIERAEALKK